MLRHLRLPLPVTAVLILSLVLTGCWGSDREVDDKGPRIVADDDQNGARGLVVGVGATAATLDPAKVSDPVSASIVRNTIETLVGFEPGATAVVPLLAKGLPELSADRLTYTFALREDVRFHDRSRLDSGDVRFSLERSLRINHPEGAAGLLAGISSLATPDARTIEITLTRPDNTFLARLADPVAGIVPSDGSYEAPERTLEDDFEDVINDRSVVGTGPYAVTEIRDGESLYLEANADYWGEQPTNDWVRVRLYAGDEQLRRALGNGDIDVALPGPSSAAHEDWPATEDIRAVRGRGALTRYVVLNTDTAPFDDVGARRAFAAAVDRARILDAAAGAGEPLHSMIPTGFAEYEPYFREYENETADSFVAAPVDFSLVYTTDRYGGTDQAVAEALQRSLEESGAFGEVTLRPMTFAELSEEAFGVESPPSAYLLGWYPDYLDADGYIAPFYSDESFTQTYQSDEMQRLIVEEQQVHRPSQARRETFARIQRLAAEDAPFIPLFEEAMVAFARPGVRGVERALGPLHTLRYSRVHRSE